MIPTTRVVFFQVHLNQNKLQKLAETAYHHFSRKERLLIFVEEAGLTYVDELLWKYPETSFLPHTVSEVEIDELIVITKSRNNLNQASFAFNLCPMALFLDPPLKIIYEFEDLTAPIKKNLSSSRFDSYKNAGFLIEASV